MRNRWVWAAAAVLLLFVGAYVASPFWAARQLRVAAATGDTDSLEKLVDFPAVRDSLRSQLTVILTERMRQDPDLKGNPFAGIGMMLMPVVINKMVDGFVTPDAIATMVAQGHVAKASGPAEGNPRVTYDYGYRALNRFDVRMKSGEAADGRTVTFAFDRRGLFTWRLVRIQIPPELLKPAR